MGRSFRSSIPVLAIGYGFSAATNFAVNVAVGRARGAAALGAFALAVSISRVFCAATDLGVNTQLTRTVARDRAAARPLFARFLALRLALVPVAIIVTVVVGRIFGERDPVLFGLVAIGQALLMIQLLYEALFLAFDEQHASASLTVGMYACLAIGCGAWLLLQGSLDVFGLVYAGATAMGIALWAAIATRRLQIRPALQLGTDALVRDLSTSWPIGVSVLLGIAALKAPVLVLGAFGRDEDVGAFSAVDMFVTATAILQSAVTNATFPRLASSYRRDPGRFRHAFWLSNLLLGVVGLGIGAFLVFFGGRVISMVFPGRDFGEITRLMPVVGWSTPMLLLVHHNIFIFAAADRERMNLAMMSTWFALLTTFELVLVPRFGLIGAAWGLLLGRTLGLAALVGIIFSTKIYRGGE